MDKNDSTEENMIRASKFFLSLIACLALALPLAAQEKSEGKKVPVILKFQIVASEYDGDKKIASYPYTLNFLEDGMRGLTSLRMGIKVPVVTEGEPGKESKVVYQDVGVNIDIEQVRAYDDGRFGFNLVVQRSSVYTQSVGAATFGRPVLANFWSRHALVLRDGQNYQGVSATDPLSGRVLKIDVTLNVVK
jgi:hypothetical protein